MRADMLPFGTPVDFKSTREGLVRQKQMRGGKVRASSKPGSRRFFFSRGGSALAFCLSEFYFLALNCPGEARSRVANVEKKKKN